MPTKVKYIILLTQSDKELFALQNLLEINSLSLKANVTKNIPSLFSLIKERCPDYVIIFSVMEHSGSVTSLKEIRNNKLADKIPIVIATGYTPESFVKKFLPSLLE